MSRRKRDENGFEKWGGYMEAKKTKLEEQFCLDAAKHSDASDVNGIFRNTAIFVNGYTIPSADELKLLMIEHGGIYHHYYRSEKTTHVIASNLPDTKIKQLKGIKVVKPDWIVDSIAKGKLLDYKLYLLYTNQSKTQPKLCLNSNLQNTNIKTEITGTGNTQESNTKTFTNHDSKNISGSSENEKAEYNSLKVTEDVVKSKDIPKAHGSNIGCKLKQNTAKTASETSFLSEFYSHSRLHHISTMGAIFKQYVSNLRNNSSGEYKGINNFKEWLSKQPKNKQMECLYDSDLVYNEDKKYKSLIMHIDMDCFFVSVGLRKRPDLKGCPVAVTHAKSNSQGVKREGMDRSLEFNLYKGRAEETYKPNKTKVEDSDEQREMNSWSERIEAITEKDSMSEIASCNYEARKAGLKNGMFLGQAVKLCPNLKTIPYDFEAYKEVSYTLYITVASYTLNIEAVSCDEMFVDCTEVLNNTSADPMLLASFLRQEIKDKTGCSCSTGFGSNRLQARLATKRAKPDGQFYMAPEEVMEFMTTVKVSDIPGVGRATSYKLSQLGINTCLDLQKMSSTKLQAEFGKKTGDTLYKNCRGQDDRTLTFNQERKSVSAEVNYGIRFENQSEADVFLKQLTTEVHSRLQEVNKATRCITLKLMSRAKEAPEESAKFLGHGVCDYTTKSSTLATATSDSNIILREVMSLVKQLNINPRELRGIGIQLTRLNDVKKQGNDVIDKFLVPINGESSGGRKQDSGIQKQENSVKHLKITDTTKASGSQKSVNINQFFKPKKSLQGIKIFSKPPPKSIHQGTLDIDVLQALPEDIRQEVFKEYGLNESDVFTFGVKDETKSCKLSKLSGSCNMSTLQGNQNPHIKEMSKTQTRDNKLQPHKDGSVSLQSVDKDESDNIKTGPLPTDLSLSEIRTLIREWVSSETRPLACDINMLKEYLQQFVFLRQLENLDITVRCLHRCIANRNSEEWKDTYFNIVNSVQDVMLTIYGAKLFVQNNF